MFYESEDDVLSREDQLEKVKRQAGMLQVKQEEPLTPTSPAGELKDKEKDKDKGKNKNLKKKKKKKKTKKSSSASASCSSSHRRTRTAVLLTLGRIETVLDDMADTMYECARLLRRQERRASWPSHLVSILRNMLC